MEKFSVLMSVYYKENPVFFDLSLESNLVKQTLTPNEFVLVCDGALTTELEDVIKKYQSLYPDILKVYRKENGGLGKALNFGLPKCSYSLVARADSDDVCAHDRFEKQVNFMADNPQYSVVSGNIDEFVDSPNSPFRVKCNPTTEDGVLKKIKVNNPINHMAVMFRKEVILSLGSYRDVPYVEDYDLWTRAHIAGHKLMNIDAILVHARVGNGMVTRRSNPKQVDGWRVINKNMLDNGVINKWTYYRNMLYIRVFVYMPTWLKNLCYKYILR